MLNKKKPRFKQLMNQMLYSGFFSKIGGHNLFKKITFSYLISRSIEEFITKNLNELFEEARIILMSVFHKADYENKYLRDSNGYIKKEPKLYLKKFFFS